MGQAKKFEGFCNFSVAHLLTKPVLLLADWPGTGVGKSCQPQLAPSKKAEGSRATLHSVRSHRCSGCSHGACGLANSYFSLCVGSQRLHSWLTAAFGAKGKMPSCKLKSMTNDAVSFPTVYVTWHIRMASGTDSWLIW